MIMLLQEVLEIYQLIDQPGHPIKQIVELLYKSNVKGENLQSKIVTDKNGSTDFIKITFPGTKGNQKGGKAPTLGIIGRLGGVGARPTTIGLVSDGDGALTALSTALKLARMQKLGDIFDGDIIITTHICTNAPTIPHDPVPFMGSPVEMSTMNNYEVDSQMDAILSVDTSRGNRIINNTGFAISPTVKQGYILRISEDLLTIMEITTGKLPVTLPITTQDITPYGNGLYHFNSILQPAVATEAPVVGVAITSEVAVPGCSTGASNTSQIEQIGRFLIEVAQSFGKNKCCFYDVKEFELLTKKYGPMIHLQSFGKNTS
jgi:hypothetical protein